MAVDVVMPQMGESIFEGTITKWLKKPGDKVERDEPLFEISTDKVDAEIPSPSAGVLKEIKVGEGKTVPIQTVVGVIDAAGDGVACDASSVGACPAEALLLNRRALRLSAQLGAGAGSVSLAEGVTAGDQSDGFFVVHRHPRERLTNILGCLDRIGNTFRAFRIDINEAHRGGAEWTREIALTGIAFVCPHPGGLMPPVDVEVWFPDVRASAGG